MHKLLLAFITSWFDNHPLAREVARDLALGAAAGGAAVVAVPVGLHALGFTSAGVAVGSVAASWQGPAVAKGSWFALAQSIGAVGGLSAQAAAGLGAGVAAANVAGGRFRDAPAPRRNLWLQMADASRHMGDSTTLSQSWANLMVAAQTAPTMICQAWRIMVIMLGYGMAPPA